MPTQTKFIAPSGGVNLDLSGIFADLDGGTSYGTATKFKVGSVDLTGYFHVSTGSDDKPNFNTGYKITVAGVATDLSAIFRRRGFVGISITDQPDNQLIVNGSNVSFSITATSNGGAFTGTYRWRKDGVNLNNGGKISGATSATLTITGATFDDNAGSYDCVLTSGGSSVTSDSALLQVKPYITSMATVPSPLTDDDGATPVAVQCYAKGSGTLYFSWFLNSVAVSGQQNQTVNLENGVGQQYVFTLTASTDGSYTCKVTSSLDATGVISDPLVATINAPTITAIEIDDSPVGATARYNDGDGFVLSVNVNNAGASPSYKWYRNSVQVATTATYTIFSLSSSNDGSYYCTVTNGGGFSQSTSVNIIRHYQSTITDQPDDTTVVANGSNDAEFSISANGVGDPIYQWQGFNGSSWVNLNNGDLSGKITIVSTIQTPNILKINNVETSDNGNKYRCIIKNLQADLVTYWTSNPSQEATLTVVTIPSIVTQPSSLLVNDVPNEQHALQVTAAGTQILYFQWFKNGSSLHQPRYGNLTPAPQPSTQDQYVFDPVNSSDIGNYFCRVTNAYGQADTSTVSVNIIAPVVSVSSQQVIYNHNNTVLLTSSLTQGTSVTYKWYKNDVEISGATNNFYSFSMNVTNTYGTYKVRATNKGGYSESSIVIYMNPYVSDQPDPQTGNVGGAATFSVVAQGSPTLSYAWYRSTNGGLTYSFIEGSALVSSFAETNLTAAYNGYMYKCRVSSNISGNPFVDSDPATLTVNYAPSNATITGNTNYYIAAAISFTASVTLGSPTSTTYTWQRSTNNGASWTQVAQTTTTSSSNQYNGPAATAAMIGDRYRCVINNSAGSVTTEEKIIYINATITQDPQPTTVNEGGSAVFSVVASGNPTITYDWYRAGVKVVPDSPSNAFLDANRQQANNGDQYYAVAKNTGGSDQSASATLTVAYAQEYYYKVISGVGQWYLGSGNISMDGGTLAGIKILMVNYTVNTYKWQKLINGTWTDQDAARNGNLIPSENGDQIVWNEGGNGINPNNAGSWRCIIANSLSGSPITSAQFNITVIQYTLTVVNGTGGGTKNPSAATFSITANAPSTGYSYANPIWSVSSGSASFANANAASTNCTIFQNSTVIANYVINQYTLTAVYGDVAGGTPSGDTSSRTANYGTTYSVTRRTYTGYTFTNWQVNSGSITYVNGTSSTSATINITIGAGNAEVEAVYSTNNYTLVAVFADIVGGTTPYGGNPDISGRTAPYETVYSATARTYSGYTFSHWQVNSGSVTYVNGTSSTSQTINIMIGAGNANIEAIYV